MLNAMKKKTLYFLYAVLFAGLIGWSSCSKKLTVAFYNIPDEQQQSLKETLSPLLTDKKGKITAAFTTLDKTQPLKKQVDTSVDLVFTYAGKQAEQLADISVKPSTEILNRMPTSMQVPGIKDKQFYAVPILVDHFEVLYLNKYIQAAKPPRSMDDFETFAKNKKNDTSYAIICAGADNRELLLFISALTESFLGTEAYEKLLALIASGTADFNTILTAPLNDNKESLKTVITKINEWNTAGIIHPAWTQAAQTDIESLIEFFNLPAIFMSLSMHRRIPVSLVRLYTPSWVPTGRAPTATRSLVVPVLMGVALSDKKTAGGITPVGVLDYLTTPEGQKNIGTAMKLGPVHSTAEPHDTEANDARLWAASTSALLYSIEQAFIDPQKAAAFADFLRTYL